MNRFISNSLVTAFMFGAVFAPQDGKPVANDDEEQAILQADHVLAEAVRTADKTATAALLDASFEWTDLEGKTRSKAETLDNLAALATDREGDKDIKTHYYGQLEIIFGFHRNARFAHIWVKRPAGWRAFVYLETPVPKQASTAARPPTNSVATGDCENPCRTLPYQPTTAADKAVLAEWQKTKVDEWHPDADDWATHIADEFLIINNISERNKAERVAIARKQQESGVGVPGDPVESMSMSDFGNAVVMISHHVPYRGGKPYYNARVFVDRNGHWLIAWSQQTTIQAAPAVAAVAEKK
jgi:hypothetical protein